MNPSNLASKKMDWRFTGVALLAMTIGAGAAGAETFQQGGSTATIEQSGGRGASHSQVIRDSDGQTIITQDGNSTDITIQRGSGAPPPDYNGHSPPPGADRFDRSWPEKRFPRLTPEQGSSDDCPQATDSSMREAFKQRMLERMRRPVPWPGAPD